MKILCIFEREDLPSSRIRIVQLLPWLKQLGVEVNSIAYPGEDSDWKLLLEGCHKYDIVWLQKSMPGLLKSIQLRRHSKKLVFDYDDAIMMRQTAKRGSYFSPGKKIRFASILSQAHGITVGNDYLAGFASGSKPKLIYPSPVPSEVSQRNYADSGNTIRLGWVGLGSNLGSLDRILPILEELSGRYPIELMILSNKKLSSDRLKVVNQTWSLDMQEHWIAQCDIGIMPLSDDSPYDKGKCSYKLLQYMASGVIPVGDAVGMNQQVIKDTENGRLVYKGDWLPVLEEVFQMTQEHKAAMGSAAKLSIKQEYTYSIQAERLKNFFQSLLKERILQSQLIPKSNGASVNP